jgi:hypothetical protein
MWRELLWPRKLRWIVIPVAGCGAECTVVGRTPAAIVVQVPTVSIEILEGAGTTLTLQRPRRVVLMSHGTGGNPLAEHALAACLAAAGFKSSTR